jgi:perosamine synthetase
VSTGEVEAVADAVRSGWIAGGDAIEGFEESWAKFCGREQGVAVCNGTVALQVALRCLELEQGDEVIMPTFTIISCALAVIEAGATPVLVDSDPETWCLDVKQVESRITKRTKAVLAVHIYGHPAEMDPLLELCAKHGIRLVEDAAEAHAAEYLSHRSGEAQWERCGSFGEISTFSFYSNKIVTTGEGGMLLMDDVALAERARRLRNLAFGPGRRFLHQELGFNYRLSNMQAALGLAQLARLDELVERKRWMGREYTARLSGVEGLQLPVEKPWARSVYWMYGVVVSEETGMDAEQLATLLADRGVETRPFFLGMHEQPVFRAMDLFRNDSFPVAERIARQGLYLPSGLALTEQQLEAVCGAIHSVLARDPLP